MAVAIMVLNLMPFAYAVLMDANAVFESLFFGTGAWIGLLIFMMLSICLVMIWKYSGVFVALIIILFQIEYYNRLDIYGNHVWKMIILLLFGLFIAIYTVTKTKPGGRG